MKKVSIVFLLPAVSLLVLKLLAGSDYFKNIALSMLIGLYLLWVIVCGGLMMVYKNTLRKYYLRIRIPFWLKFVCAATLLALIEEAIAVGINNYFYSFTSGRVSLTASQNYWLVVSRHSVIVLVPIFFILGLLIKRFKWTPTQSFLIMGMVGILAEMSVNGILALVEFGLWLPVYGLMVYLPANID